MLKLLGCLFDGYQLPVIGNHREIRKIPLFELLVVFFRVCQCYKVAKSQVTIYLLPSIAPGRALWQLSTRAISRATDGFSANTSDFIIRTPSINRICFQHIEFMEVCQSKIKWKRIKNQEIQIKCKKHLANI